MKANELRIGNYYNQFENTEKVSWSTLKTLEESTTEQLWCKPIPLTEEWLLKFGFEKDGEQFNFKGLSIELVGDDGRWCLYMLDEYHNVESSIALFKHIHQLQNLYFALTNEELTFKSE